MGGVSPPPGEGSGDKAMIPPQKKISILDLKMANLGAFWALFYTVELFGLNAKSSAFTLRKLAVACMLRVKGIKTSLLKRVSLITSITVTSYHTANQTDGWRGDGGHGPPRSL